MSVTKSAAVLFFSQMTLYAVITLNMIVVAQKNYALTALSDFAIGSLNYFMIRRISATTENWKLWLAYALGGVLGSMVGIALAP